MNSNLSIILEKTINKWQKIKKEKDEEPESLTAINFKTHEVSHSQVHAMKHRNKF
jgi:hypothetical protein